MEHNARGWLFRKRNILGATLIAGIVVGTYLPNFWNGFGGGSIVGVGVGDPKTGTPSQDSEDSASKPEDKAKPVESDSKPLENVPPVIKVVIDERSYFLRSAEGDRPIEVPEVIALAKAAAGDADGIRIRIYRKKTSRIKAEQDLQDSLVAAGVSDSAILWIPVAID